MKTIATWMLMAVPRGNHGARNEQPCVLIAHGSMRWSWELQPKGVFNVMGPLIARIGRRQEAKIWAGLKRYMENAAHRAAE